MGRHVPLCIFAGWGGAPLGGAPGPEARSFSSLIYMEREKGDFAVEFENNFATCSGIVEDTMTEGVIPESQIKEILHTA